MKFLVSGNSALTLCCLFLFYNTPIQGEQLTSEEPPTSTLKLFPFCRPNINPQTSFCPVQRYCDFDYYDVVTKRFFRNKLGYSRNTWNCNDGRKEDFESISFDELDDLEREALEMIGFDEDSHDCCHGHYEGYDWSDFSDNPEVKEAWRLLGYNKVKWDLGRSTDFEELSWDELSSEQQEALSEVLCYTKELWDGVSLLSWPQDAVIPGGDIELEITNTTTSSSPSVSPTSTALPTITRTDPPVVTTKVILAPLEKMSSLTSELSSALSSLSIASPPSTAALPESITPPPSSYFYK